MDCCIWKFFKLFRFFFFAMQFPWLVCNINFKHFLGHHNALSINGRITWDKFRNFAEFDGRIENSFYFASGSVPLKYG